MPNASETLSTEPVRTHIGFLYRGSWCRKRGPQIAQLDAHPARDTTR